MSFEATAVSLLLGISALLGVDPVARDTAGWTVTENWHETPAPSSDQGTFMRFAAESTEIPRRCQENPDSYLVFPTIIHGSHIVQADGHVVLKFGDPTFQTMRSFYGQPVLNCRDILGTSTLKWEAFSYTKYFARVGYFPTISARRPIYNVFSETFHIIGAGAGLIMAVFTFAVFAGKVSRQTTLAVCLSAFFSSFYLGGCVAGFMGLQWSMLTAHKIADTGVWLAICLLVKALYHEDLVSARVFQVYLGAVVLAILLILWGNSGDLVQFGTTIPFGLTLGVLSIPMLKLGATLPFQKQNRLLLLQFLSLGSFVSAVFNEMFAVTGLIHSSPMLPFGFMGGFMFLALSVNERVNATYRERDYLRYNLEKEVQMQTAEIQRKSTELESALNELKSTQAELVQSAKLASLGTLSAGIAHEINNSLNYVNGALQPLEDILNRSAMGTERDRIKKLFSVMKDGLHLTLDIIRSLRTYTGLNQAKFNDVNIKNVVNSALTILRTRIRGKTTVVCDIPDDLTVFGSVVGLNQIFMNLISNALDAMPNGGTLVVRAAREDGHVHLSIQDTGGGIPPNIADRIFEPFFTTKDVGSGTGLGLHIVKQEVGLHKGSIRVESDAGVGATFHITLPAQAVTAETGQGVPVGRAA